MPLVQAIPGGQRAERADPVPDATWEEHRATIEGLYPNMKLEDLITHMDDNYDFIASEQQYKMQFSKWGLRKNKRRIDQRHSSPPRRQPTRHPPNLRSVEYAPYQNDHIFDFNGFQGAPNFSSYGVTQPFGQQPDPFFQSGTGSLNNVFMPPYGNYMPAYQPQQPFMYGQSQQHNALPGALAGQVDLQVSNYNFVSAGSGSSQLPARQMSQARSAAAAAVAKPSRQPIHQAVQSGSLRGTKLLVDANPSCVHALDADGIGTAWIAAQGGHADILRLLIMQKPEVDLNVPDREHQRCPIHQAAQSGHVKAVELLLKNGADPDPVDNDGITPLWLAAQSGHHDIVRMILDLGGADVNVDAEWESKERRPIHQAAQNGHLKIVQLLLAKGAACDPVDVDGATPLWSAAQNGDADLLRELLKAGAKFDGTPYDKNRQPIHQAAQNGHLEAVRALLDAGASLMPENDTFDDSEPSPFLLACGNDKPELINLFLDRGVDVNMVFKNGKGALHFAAYGGHVPVAQILLEKGCDVDARECDGWTPLMLAAQEGHLPFASLLINNHANVDAEEKEGATSLWIAAQQGHASVVKCLLDAGAKQLGVRGSGRRPIHQAAQNAHLACVKLLLKHCPSEVDATAGDGYTALTLASQKDKPANLAVMRYLVSQGAKVT